MNIESAATPPAKAASAATRRASAGKQSLTSRSGTDATTGGFLESGREGSAADFEPMDAGRSLGRFQIEGVLGHGGMGTVYRAFDPLLGRRIALKVPRFDPTDDPALHRQFLCEARAAAAVSHPNLVEVYEVGTIGEAGAASRRCYIVSALCHGPNLAEWLERRESPAPPSLAAALLTPLAEAVDRCHAAGVIHRDLKPGNVLLDTPTASAPASPKAGAEAGASGGTSVGTAAGEGSLPFVPKVSDFGVARVLEESAASTRISRAVGTPLYMSPEQAAERCEEVGPATDVWALGVILYELLTGRPPFNGATTLTLLRRIAEDDPLPPRAVRPGTPAGLDAICMKCLRKRPEDRYASAADLAADLMAWREGRSVSARRFCWRDRFDTWSRRPDRLRDAGVVIIVWNAPFAASMAIMAVDVGQGGAAALPKQDELMAEAIVGSLMSVAMAFLGYRVLRGGRWAWRLALVALIGQTIYTSGGWIWGGGAGFSIYEQLPAAKYLVMLSVTAGVALQLAALLLSARARVPDQRG